MLGEALRDAARLRRVRDHSPSYQAHGSVAALLSSTDDEIVISGPAGTGKSLGALHKVHAAMWAYPGARALVVRKTRASCTESVLVTYESYVLGLDNPICAGVRRDNRHSYRYPNGSEIIIGGLDQITRVMSTEYDLVYVPEAIEITEGEWEGLNSRIGRRGLLPHEQLIADTNPDVPNHWLKQRCERGMTRMLYSTHEDNPTLYDRSTGQWTERGKRYLARLDKLTGVRYERLRWGRWVAAEGMVYEDWTPSVHIVRRFDIPASWRRIRSIDFGFSNPFVCQWWAVSPDGGCYRYREIYYSGRIVEDHARQIVALSEGENIELTVADHDAEDRATLYRCGISTAIADKAVSPGVQAVQARLRVDEQTGPRLFLMADSLVERDSALVDAKLPTCTEEEIPGYVWPVGVDGRPVKEAPVKLHDHGLDAMRYAILQVDGRPRVLFASVGRQVDATARKVDYLYGE